MSEVTRYNKLQLDNIQYDKPENKGTVYFGSMLYDLNPLLLQSSRLKVKEIKEVEKQRYIVLETDDTDFSFYDKLVQLDDHILDATYQNSEEWFNKELPMDILEGMYKRITKPFKKDEKPSLEFKLPYHSDKLQTKVYGQTNELIDLDNLTVGSTVILMLQVKGLKFLKQNYYCDTYLSQIKLIKETVTVKPASCLIEDDEVGVVQNEENYDYEILDEEIFKKNKEIEVLESSILKNKQLIEEDENNLETIISEKKNIIEQKKEELSKLEEQLQNLK
jgi:vacuolar-type H+-ATPase subunit I/STV1